MFKDVFFGWPGRAHDAFIWQNSPIGKALESGNLKLPFDGHILGDSAYPLLPYLITPYRDNGFLTDNHRKFNYIHSTTRVCIEQAFGILKGKFRILNHLKVSLPNAKYVVMSCIILHNFVRLNSTTPNDLDEIGNFNVEDEIQEESIATTQTGISKRDVLSEWMFPIM